MRPVLAVLLCSLAGLSLPPAPAPAEEPAVPRDEAAARLARDVIARLTALHFRLDPAATPGFVARFDLFSGEQRLGTLDAGWNAPRETLRVRFDGSLPADRVARIESLFRQLLDGALVPDWNPEHLYARETAEDYVFDNAGETGEDGGQKRHVDHVRKDLLSWRHEIEYRDGWVCRDECAYVLAEGRAFLRTWRGEARTEGAPPRVFDAAFTYTHREGGVFVRRIEARDDGTPLRLELREVAFRTPREGEPAEDGALLAEEVLERIGRVHYSLWYRGVAGFTAEYALGIYGKGAGTVVYRFDRNAGALDVSHEVGAGRAAAEEFERWNRETLTEWVRRETGDWMWYAVLLGFGSTADFSMRAVRGPDGIELLQRDLTGSQPRREIVTRLSPEFEVRSKEERYRDGAVHVFAFEHVAAEGWRVKKAVVSDYRPAGAKAWRMRLQYAYRWEGEELFPRTIHAFLDAASPDQQPVEVVLTLQRVEFRRE